MALFRFNCGTCQKHPVAKFGRTQAEALAKAGSCPCGGELVRISKPPTSQVMERLDDGFMPRAVERPADAERLYKERAAADPLKEK